MGKKFIPILCNKRVHRVFCDDIKKLFYLAKRKTPKIPQFIEDEDQNYPDIKLTLQETECQS